MGTNGDISPVPPELPPHLQPVVPLLHTDLSEKSTASQLGLTLSTIHTYATNVYGRYGVHGRRGFMAQQIKRLEGKL